MHTAEAKVTAVTASASGLKVGERLRLKLLGQVLVHAGRHGGLRREKPQRESMSLFTFLKHEGTKHSAHWLHYILKNAERHLHLIQDEVRG